MAEHPAEVAEITRSSHALALNLGNITDARMKSMPESLKIAASLHIPVMLDLVGTACSNLRYEFAQKLMNIHMPELLKGNMSELLAMSGQTAHAIGIDAGVQDVLTDANRSHLKELFQEKASQWNTTLLITGKEDMIVSASKCEFITNGTPAMSQITGTGCMLGMISRQTIWTNFFHIICGNFFILFPHCAFFPVLVSQTQSPAQMPLHLRSVLHTSLHQFP